ncbi:MAG: hypothetical protein M3517_06045 [Actinomycetota bacterium]|nr:hypothetical protein [Actinomycetota bacterium]
MLRRRGRLRSTLGDVVSLVDDGTVSIEVDLNRPSPPPDEALTIYVAATRAPAPRRCCA